MGASEKQEVIVGVGQFVLRMSSLKNSTCACEPVQVVLSLAQYIDHRRAHQFALSRRTSAKGSYGKGESDGGCLTLWSKRNSEGGQEL